MIIKLKDGTELTVSKQQADDAEQAIESDVVSIKVNDTWVRADWVAVIKPGGYTEADTRPMSEAPQIKADNRTEEEQYQAARKKSNELRDRLKQSGLI